MCVWPVELTGVSISGSSSEDEDDSGDDLQTMMETLLQDGLRSRGGGSAHGAELIEEGEDLGHFLLCKPQIVTELLMYGWHDVEGGKPFVWFDCTPESAIEEAPKSAAASTDHERVSIMTASAPAPPGFRIGDTVYTLDSR